MTFSFDELCKNDPVRGWDEEPRRDHATNLSRAFFKHAIAALPTYIEFAVAPAPICAVYFDPSRDAVIPNAEGEQIEDSIGCGESSYLKRRSLVAEGWAVKVDPKDEVKSLVEAWRVLMRQLGNPTKAKQRLLVGWYTRFVYRETDLLRARLWVLVLPSCETLSLEARMKRGS